MSDTLDRVKGLLTTIRRGSLRGRLKPHKPLLMLAVLDLFEAGVVRDNHIFFDEGLVERFGEYFKVVAREGDWCQPAPPFFHLRADGFWSHKVIDGREDQYALLKSSGGGTRRILDNIEYASLSSDALTVVSDPTERQQLRQFIVETFFESGERQRLWEVVKSQERIADCESLIEGKGLAKVATVDVAVRIAAFGRVVRRSYDYQCAVCGLRIIGPDGSTPIDAAHLIPWHLSHDDSPNNGMALCKLHHWALDANLIAPSHQFTWIVSTLLDRRRNSERELTRFHGSAVLLPRSKEQHPRLDSIQWRFDRLAK